MSTIGSCRWLAAAAVALAFGVAACGAANEEPADSGSSTPAAARHGGRGGAVRQPRRRGLERPGSRACRRGSPGSRTANPDVTVSYDPVGSGGGREQFVAGGTHFGGTDSRLKDEELTGAQERCGGPDNLIEIPVYISPIAVIYNLEGVDNLQLSPETLAKIFEQEIKNWNDPAIKADNPDATLPSDAHHRRSTAPTSRARPQNFTEYLAADGAGRLDARGRRRVADQGRRGRSGHLRRRRCRQGRQGHDRLRRREPGRRARQVAKIKVGDEFVAPTPEAAAKVVERSKETDDPGTHVFTYDARPHHDRGRHVPDRPRLLPDGLHEVRRRRPGRARQGATSSYVISAEGQAGRREERRLGADQRRGPRRRSSPPSTRSPAELTTNHALELRQT